jgi:glycosyltransferase involved in cell wall biosynthesis
MLITCLCVTRDRRHWIQKAIDLFRKQTYLNKELVIVADGYDIRQLVPYAKNIRLVQLRNRLTIGAKRNYGNAFATGEVIAHWDDDDWSAPERLAGQVAMLENSGKAVAGYYSMLFTDGPNWWRFLYSAPYAIGTSLCYRKSFWAEHPFEDRQVGEDGAFQKTAARAKQLVSADARTMMVASVHAGNTSTRIVANYAVVERPEGIGSPFA